MTWRIINADCVEAMRAMPEASVDAIVCDPPYGLEFMGKDWDGADGFRRTLNAADVARDSVFGRTSAKAPEYRTTGAGQKSAPGIGERETEWVSNQGWNGWRCKNCGHLPHGGSPCRCDKPEMVRADNRWHLFQSWSEAWAREALRVLRPGGHLLAFGGTRTYHRMACAIEDAGFEIRDSLHWIYLSGFPKSLDASKAIDESLGMEREVIGPSPFNANKGPDPKLSEKCAQAGHLVTLTAPASWAARQWDGWGTALKPSHEPVVMARKPLAGTVAANLLKHGVGGINVDACRVAIAESDDIHAKIGDGVFGGFGHADSQVFGDSGGSTYTVPAGRWPPNVLLSEAAAEELDRQSGDRQSGDYGLMGYGGSGPRPMPAVDGDCGGASRVFPVFRYCAKPSRAERDAGLSDLEAASGGAATDREDGSDGLKSPRAGAGRGGGSRNIHPTVKPIALMEWLVRLVTPPGGVVLDPFLGSGTTGCAAVRQGFDFIGIEREAEYVAIAERRIALAANAPRTKGLGELDRADDAPRNQLGLFGKGAA